MTNLYVGTNTPIKNNELIIGDEGKFWATSNLDYAIAYASSPKGNNSIGVSSGNKINIKYNSSRLSNGYIYKIINPNVYIPEYGIEYTTTHVSGKYVKFIGRAKMFRQKTDFLNKYNIKSETTTSINIGNGVQTKAIKLNTKDNKFNNNSITTCPKCRCRLDNENIYKLKTTGRCTCNKCQFLIRKH